MKSLIAGFTIIVPSFIMCLTVIHWMAMPLQFNNPGICQTKGAYLPLTYLICKTLEPR